MISTDVAFAPQGGYTLMWPFRDVQPNRVWFLEDLVSISSIFVLNRVS